MTPRPLEDKVIVIIGGTTGLGLSAAQACVKAGANVVVVGRDRDNAKAAAKGLGATAKSLSGDASDPDTAAKIAPADTFVQLVGVAHPSPSKAAEFRSIDLASSRSAVEAAKSAGMGHFVYVSVAHPAPVMKAYIESGRNAKP